MSRNNYNPNQPRVPAGDSKGGQWTSDGSGAGKSARQAAGLRSEMDMFAQKIRNRKTEIAAAFDENGAILFQAEGNGNSVSFTHQEAELMHGATTVHNHPIVGSFSTDDIMVMSTTNQKEMIVIDPKYTYTMINPNWYSWNGQGYSKWNQYHFTNKIVSINAIENAMETVKKFLQHDSYNDLSWEDMLEDNAASWNINHYINEEFAKIRGWIYTREER